MAAIDTGPLERELFGKEIGVLPVVIFDALRVLSWKEREVIEMRYGLRNGVLMGLAEVASKLRVSKQRIGQLEKRALFKLRGPMAQYAEALREAGMGK